jgi:hypothetical protein
MSWRPSRLRLKRATVQPILNYAGCLASRIPDRAGAASFRTSAMRSTTNREPRRIPYATEVRLRQLNRRTPIIGHTVDLGLSGMLVRATEECAIGTRVMCMIRLPEGERRFSGKVVRVEPAQAGDGFSMGIEFGYLPPADRTWLADFMRMCEDQREPVEVRFEGVPEPVQAHAIVNDEALRLSTVIGRHQFALARPPSEVDVAVTQTAADLAAEAEPDRVAVEPARVETVSPGGPEYGHRDGTKQVAEAAPGFGGSGAHEPSPPVSKTATAPSAARGKRRRQKARRRGRRRTLTGIPALTGTASDDGQETEMAALTAGAGPSLAHPAAAAAAAVALSEAEPPPRASGEMAVPLKTPPPIPKEALVEAGLVSDVGVADDTAVVLLVRRRQRLKDLLVSAAALVGGAIATALLVMALVGRSPEPKLVPVSTAAQPTLKITEGAPEEPRPVPSSTLTPPSSAQLPAATTSTPQPAPKEQESVVAQPTATPSASEADDGAKTRPVATRLPAKLLPPGTPGPEITYEGEWVTTDVPILGSTQGMSHYSLARPPVVVVNLPYAESELPLGIHVIKQNGLRTVTIVERPRGGIQVRFSFVRPAPAVQALEVNPSAVKVKVSVAEAEAGL